MKQKPVSNRVSFQSGDGGAFGMKFLALVVFLLASLPALAQDSSQYRACKKKARTQMEMNGCASKESARVDLELTDVYEKLLSKAAKQEEAVAKIKIFESAWAVYRDAYLDAMFPAKDKQAEYGSMYPMEVDLLRAQLTRRQIATLREWLSQYQAVSTGK
jgi:uncharacterized protein YecT (DUF1311 family)